jgi:hypothetical protein
LGEVRLSLGPMPRSSGALAPLSHARTRAFLLRRNGVMPYVCNSYGSLGPKRRDLEVPDADRKSSVPVRSFVRECRKETFREVIERLTSSHFREPFTRSSKNTRIALRYDLRYDLRYARLPARSSREAAWRVLRRDVPGSPTNITGVPNKPLRAIARCP